jgi:hypothetical protein
VTVAQLVMTDQVTLLRRRRTVVEDGARAGRLIASPR